MFHHFFLQHKIFLKNEKYGNGSLVKDLYLVDVKISSSNNSLGALFGGCENTTIVNVHLNASRGKLNFLSSTSSASYTQIGGICGWARAASNLSSCSVSNTVLVGGNTVGGIVGAHEKSSLSDCYNFGISNQAKEAVVVGTWDLGGLVGYCCECTISRSGFHQGSILSLQSREAKAGGVVGEANSPKLLSSLFSGVDSVVNCTNAEKGYCAGIVGFLHNSFAEFPIFVEQVHSEGLVVGANQIGGLFGVLQFSAGGNRTAVISSSLSQSPIFATNSEANTIGNLIGQVVASANSSFSLKMNNVTFHSNNSFPAIGSQPQNLFIVK